MSIKDYLKQRWYMFAIVAIASVFSFLVSWASADMVNNDFLYIVEGISLAFIVFVFTDYIKLKSRINKMKEFLDSNCTQDVKSNYPLDIEYAKAIKDIVDKHNKYRKSTYVEHSNELEFITKWVHDVKVPISAISLITEKMDSDESQLIEMQLNYIDQNIQKILYHIKSKRFYDDYKIKHVSIKNIVNQALKNYAVFFAYKSISLIMDCNDYMIYTDEKWSIYIVSQLISNAVKYTNTNGEIIISSEDLGNRIALRVKNSGEGISENNINNIFKQGYSSYSTRKDKSTGYGLYLSKKLSDKMGHGLEVESKIKEYAEFTIYYNKETDNTHVTRL